MSSDRTQHINLTRADYEEYFLLYVDGELSPEAMDAVEAFAALHPDLREELDLLLETRLDSEPVSFGDPSLLLAEHMRASSLEEEILTHIDGELAPEAARALEVQLQRDLSLRTYYETLLAAKLDPADVIAYPEKESLYRREEKRRPFAWWRAAAAVLLLAGGAALWQTNNGNVRGTGEGVTASNVKPATKAPATSVITNTNPVPEINRASIPAENPDRINTVHEDAVALAARNVKTTAKPAHQKTADPVIARPDPRDRVIASGNEEVLIAHTTVPLTRSIERNENGTSLSQNIKEAIVTTAPALTYNPMNTATATEATAAVLHSEKPQASFRGFLRKAARFVEKRTGIRATNDDDQLVVGAVAFNLK
jgi:hypothetical protein